MRPARRRPPAPGTIQETRIVPSVAPAPLAPARVAREFRRLLEDGVRLHVAGGLRHRPERLLSLGYVPRFRIDLFDTRYYLTRPRQNYYLRFFVAYVVQGRDAWARIFYKDAALVWRSGSHVGRLAGAFWIGKGDTYTVVDETSETTYSREETTDLPFEIQGAVEDLNRMPGRIPNDDTVIERVLRRVPEGRIEPYRDFLAPRRRAQAEPRNRIHGGRPVAWFTRAGDPTSLCFAPGYEPDFARGILEEGAFTSRLYGGALRRFRILSRNRRIQYLFFAGPRQAWIIPPQALTTELSSYGVRTVDVSADEVLFVPGYEYHFLDDSHDPPVLYSQIPEGFVGAASEVDDARADASPWLDRLPVIREFRRVVLARRGRAGAGRAARG
jgi:hypothetical protein